MKKKNIVLGLAVVAALNVASFQPANAGSNPFATVPQSTGYYQDVVALVHDGLIDGYADSDFKANRPLTRYEMAVFTAKAMSNSNKANAADTQRIQKLMKAFQSELTDMHVAIPGVKAKSAKKEAKPAKANFKVPDGWQLSGTIRYRLDGGTKKYPDGSKKTGADGFGGAKNHQLLWQYNNKFKMGGGWTAELDLIGARDGNGDSRTTGENTVGYATANKIFAQGPLFGGRARIGKTKGSFVGIKKSLIMGQYYTGGDYMYSVSPKWKIGAAWGNVDYNKSVWSGDTNHINSTDNATLLKKGKSATISDVSKLSAVQKMNLQNLISSGSVSVSAVDKTGAATTTVSDIVGSAKLTNATKADITVPFVYWKPERGVSGSDMNPDGLGVSMTQFQSSYRPTSNFAVNMSYWHLHAKGGDHYYLSPKNAAANRTAESYGLPGTNSAKYYKDPNIGELNLVWNVSPKVELQAFYAQSDWKEKGGQNKAYALTAKWGNAQAGKAHSRHFELDLIHQEQYTGIKSSFDLKNKEGEGQHGLIAEYRYVPVKNVMFDWRWMHYRAINCKAASKYLGNQYRFQLYYYF